MSAVIHCDRCGQEDRTRSGSGICVKPTGFATDTFESHDLCKACTMLLHRYLKGKSISTCPVITSLEVTEPSPATPHRAKVPTHIDIAYELTEGEPRRIRGYILPPGTQCEGYRLPKLL